MGTMYNIGDDVLIEKKINDEVYSYKTRIADITNDYFDIEEPINRDTGQFQRLSKGEELIFVFQDKQHVPHRFVSSVTGSKTENEVTFYMVKHPVRSEIKRIQRRNYLRMPLITNVQLKGEDIGVFTAITTNISGGGLAFITDVPLEEGQFLKWNLSLNVEGESIKIEGEGEVVRVEINEEDTRLISIDFTDLSSENEQYIIRYCLSEQVKLRRIKNN